MPLNPTTGLHRPVPRPSPTGAMWLPLLTYVGVVVILKILHANRDHAFIGKYLSTFALLIFLYTPLLFVLLKKSTPDAMGLHLHQIGWSLKVLLLVMGIVFVPFIVGFVLWQHMVVGGRFNPDWTWPGLHFLSAQFLGAAIPEEVFYRGWLQSQFNGAWPTSRTIMGARIGKGLVFTSFLFALGHVIIEYSPVRVAVFFPSLIFGWLREKTDGLVAPILFHGLSNLLMATLQSAFLQP